MLSLLNNNTPTTIASASTAPPPTTTSSSLSSTCGSGESAREENVNNNISGGGGGNRGGVVVVKIFRCKLCHKFYKSRRSLLRHQISHHGKSDSQAGHRFSLSATYCLNLSDLSYPWF
ncbi:unnamed protein product [Trichobilharzia regenti]|nr:unnamed protein product [Trichobilharzia regenti]